VLGTCPSDPVGVAPKLKKGVKGLDWFYRGGIVMAPILAFSIVAFGILLERLWVLRRSNVLPRETMRKIEYLLRRKRIEEARQFCTQESSPVTRILLAGLQHVGHSRASIKDSMEEAGKSEAMELRKFVGLLGTIASVCPLLGLLGTVSGMIKVFEAIYEAGVATPGNLAGGISEALITTVAGLAVAIPAFLGQKVIASWADRFVHLLEESSTYLLNLLTEPVGEEERSEA